MTMLENWDYQEALQFLDRYAQWQVKAASNESIPDVRFFNYSDWIKDILLGSLMGGSFGIAANYVLEPERRERDFWNNFGLGSLIGASAGGLWNYFK